MATSTMSNTGLIKVPPQRKPPPGKGKPPKELSDPGGGPPGEGGGSAPPPGKGGKGRGKGGDDATTGGSPGEATLIRDIAEMFPRADERRKALIQVYAQLAEDLKIELEGHDEPEESTLPAPPGGWTLGDPVASIDWRGTISRRGMPIFGVNVLKREVLKMEETRPGEGDFIPWIEIYIDTSGTMQNPTTGFSEMALAGFALAQAALKAGGWVRVIAWSSKMLAARKFYNREELVYESLMAYEGGGTNYPYAEILRSRDQWRSTPIYRVILTDTDYHYGDRMHPFRVREFDATPDGLEKGRSYRLPRPASLQEVVRRATEGENRLVILASGFPRNFRNEAARITRAGGGIVLGVPSGKLPEMAVEIGEALYGK